MPVETPRARGPTDLQLVLEEQLVQGFLRLPDLQLRPLPQKRQPLLWLLLVQLQGGPEPRFLGGPTVLPPWLPPSPKPQREVVPHFPEGRPQKPPTQPLCSASGGRE